MELSGQSNPSSSEGEQRRLERLLRFKRHAESGVDSGSAVPPMKKANVESTNTATTTSSSSSTCATEDKDNRLVHGVVEEKSDIPEE